MLCTEHQKRFAYIFQQSFCLYVLISWWIVCYAFVTPPQHFRHSRRIARSEYCKEFNLHIHFPALNKFYGCYWTIFPQAVHIQDNHVLASELQQPDPDGHHALPTRHHPPRHGHTNGKLWKRCCLVILCFQLQNAALRTTV